MEKEFENVEKLTCYSIAIDPYLGDSFVKEEDYQKLLDAYNKLKETKNKTTSDIGVWLIIIYIAIIKQKPLLSSVD